MAIINGSSGVDNLRATSASDLIRLFAGNDSVLAYAGNDTVYAGSGNDRVDGGSGNDRLYGDAGNDTLWGRDGNDTAWGGAGKDSINGDAGRDLLDGGLGDDILDGGDGNDTLIMHAGRDSLSGGDGNDLILVQGELDSLTVLVRGGDGHDTIRLEMDGGDADGAVFGDAGDDRIEVSSGYSGTVDLFGGTGNDWLGITGYGRGAIEGGDGNDTIDAGGGRVHGGNGDDTISGSSSEYSDLIYGDAGDDTLTSSGSFGDIRYNGNTFYGGAGDDLILVGAPDEGWGNNGEDTLVGGILSGGAGLDTFIFRSLESPEGGYSYKPWHTRVRDYQNGENISLAHAEKIASYDPAGGYIDGFTLTPLTGSDLDIARSGTSLVISGPDYETAGGYVRTIYGGDMTLVGFFARGLTSIAIDGVAVDVSGLA